MTRGEFTTLVERAISTVPQVFLDRVENLSFQVADWAEEDILAEVGFDDPRDLLGFYAGWPLTERGHQYGNCLPDVILIFQGAVESYVAESGEPVMRVIRETILHELAHYFGFSEEDMDEIEALWAGQPGDEEPTGSA